MTGNSRYNGKPLLRLLELYVLKAINELPQKEHQTLENMAPKLRNIYGGDGEWHESVAKAINLPSSMPDAIREIWEKNLQIARVNQVRLQPQEFAERFVDDNFAL